jgi:hypothetical protein
MDADDARQLSLMEEAAEAERPADPDVPVFAWSSASASIRAQAQAGVRVTDAVAASSVTARRYVGLVSWTPGTIDGVALLTKGRVAATERVQLHVRALRECGPVQVERLLRALDASVRGAARTALSSTGALEPKVAAAVRGAARRVDASLAQAWNEIEELARHSLDRIWAVEDDREPIVAYEREATGIALELAGLRRERHLVDWNGSATESFLLGFDAVSVDENGLIAADSRHFGDWQRADDRAVAFRFVEGQRAVTVINAHAKPIETALGCDLIYYTHEYDSYVLVQYKRMRPGRNRWEFRPSADKHFEDELKRLRAVRSSPSSARPEAWRLGRTCCFVKLCEPVIREPLMGQLARGLYLPLEYLDCVRTARSAVGPRGGEVFAEGTVGRWLSNTGFVHLVQRAWVGTDGVTSKRIAEVVRATLDAGRSAVMAVGSARTPRGAS